MSALPRPDLPPGPHRELVAALHDLHHRAGWPSLRTLARDTGVSHTTVSKVLSAPALPSWGTVELLVEAMGGDIAEFHHLWLTASTPATAMTIMAPRIAGRRAELDVVRRHFEVGSGLLLVSGEAGIGKSTLVTAAAESTDTFVTVGHCLPLSTEAPLMPVAEALGRLVEVDKALWIKEALADSPPFVGAALALLLPELVEGGDVPSSDDQAPHRLFTAVAKLLEALAARRPMALLLEDLHWADAATLDLVETLLARDAGAPILGTWRTEDPATSGTSTAWQARVRRAPGFHGLSLGPLTQEETVEQLRLLTGAAPAPDLVERVHARSLGQPLFTEQLANSGDSEDDLPTVLADLLDSRVAGLSEPAWGIARTLGVADRPLPVELLRRAAGLTATEGTAALRELEQHRLLDTTESDDVRLRHPLLAEAAQRRLVPGEGKATHETLAELLGAEPDASPAEVATHWQGAGDNVRELDWRIAAARAAQARWAATPEAEHWLRALEIWPSTCASAGEPPVTRPDAYIAAMEALLVSLQFHQAAAMNDAAAALFPDAEPRVRAELLRRAAVFRGYREGYDVGLRLIEEAIALFRTLPPSAGLIQALNHKQYFLTQGGQSGEAFTIAREAVRVAEKFGDASSHRHQLSWVAWHEGMSGSPDLAAETMARARALLPRGTDPTGDIREAMLWTDVLLSCGARSEEIEAAGRGALAVAAEWEIENERTVNIRFNIVLALIRDGRVTDAAAEVDPRTEARVDPDHGEYQLLRAFLDAVRGRLPSAESRAATVWKGWLPTVAFDLDYTSIYAAMELWNDAPHHALDLLQTALEANVDTGLPSWTLPVLGLAARAAADCAGDETRDPLEVRSLLADLYRRARLGPSTQPHNRAAPALRASWTAEIARLDGTETMRHWLAAVSEWDRLARPHDAAYSRWRGAQRALRDGQGTVAARLLRRAALDAREHIPLSRAIARTAAR